MQHTNMHNMHHSIPRRNHHSTWKSTTMDRSFPSSNQNTQDNHSRSVMERTNWKSATMDDSSTFSTQDEESYFEDPALTAMICGGRDCLQHIGSTFPYATPFPSTDDDDDDDDDNNNNDNDNITARRSRRPKFSTKRFPPAHYYCKEDETQPTHEQDIRTACTSFVAPPMIINLWKWLKKRRCFGYCTQNETTTPTISSSWKSSSHQSVSMSVHRQSVTQPQGEVIAY